MAKKKTSRASKKKAAKKARDTHQGKRARVRTVNAVKGW